MGPAFAVTVAEAVRLPGRAGGQGRTVLRRVAAVEPRALHTGAGTGEARPQDRENPQPQTKGPRPDP